MKPLGRRLSPMLALLLFFVFSPAGLEIAHTVSHRISGDSHLHWHDGMAHRHAHGAGHHRLLPEASALTALQDAPPAFEIAAAPTAQAEPSASAAFRPRPLANGPVRLELQPNGPPAGRSPPA